MIFDVISLLIETVHAALYITHPNPSKENKFKLQQKYYLKYLVFERS
jgi:hypothetical protein